MKNPLYPPPDPAIVAASRAERKAKRTEYITKKDLSSVEKANASKLFTETLIWLRHTPTKYQTIKPAYRGALNPYTWPAPFFPEIKKATAQTGFLIRCSDDVCRMTFFCMEFDITPSPPEEDLISQINNRKIYKQQPVKLCWGLSLNNNINQAILWPDGKLDKSLFKNHIDKFVCKSAVCLI